ncbi:right-handed parallel beta-helix repeat-containing protein, partial [Candidatus Bathyarchaeota archaeon]|nr:right-handed parallel beta-helix repeat-containing protein [Candidatus Bathyarchaeota archaeon]
MNKTVLTSFTILCLLTTVFLMASSFNIQTVKASGTIYIRADGSVDPPTANIATANNVTYTFTSNINDLIVVEKGDIIIDGKGYLLHGLGDLIGFRITDVNNVTIQNTEIRNFDYGIWLDDCSNNTVSGNNITNNYFGIYLFGSSENNTISGNNITNNDNGIRLYRSSDRNTISSNNITNNSGSIGLFGSSDNTISGNNITNNSGSIWLSSSSDNTISGNNIANNSGGGMWLLASSDNTISGNNIINSSGISLSSSYNNTISGNNIANGGGISLSGSYNNTISGNNMTNNKYCISLSVSSNNIIIHNDFVNNTKQVYSLNRENVWDNGFEGNYWSNYAGLDLDNDGVGDSWYEIGSNNIDHYPLMGMFSEFNTTAKHDVQT